MAVGTAEWIVGRIEAADIAGVAARYAPNVLLDVHTPAGRVQLQGIPGATELLAEHHGTLTNASVPWLRTTVARDVVVIEYELRWEVTAGECISRAVSVYRLSDGAIVEHTHYSCGQWTPEDVRRIMSEAPIVRW